MEPASRMAARLAGLVDLAVPGVRELLEIAAAGCEASAEVKNRADAILAAHKPLEPKAVEGVLLSSDLVPHLLAPLELEDGAVASVCLQWAAGWKATNESRRRLIRVPFEFPQFLSWQLRGKSSLCIAVMPDQDTWRDDPNEQQLVVSFDSGHAYSALHTLPRGMSGCSGGSSLPRFGEMAASAQFLYTTGVSGVRCFTYDGTMVADYAFPDKAACCPVLGPDLLFCVLYDEDSEEETADQNDEIVALDAQTLQPLYRFGLSLLDDACGLVVINEELFVCDTGNNRIQVFSLAGEHRRSITGEFKRPVALCFVKDRLYLVEDSTGEEDVDGPGHRICVLSLQGDLLQVYINPAEDQIFADMLCCFDGKLLAPVLAFNGYEFVHVGVKALRDIGWQGLDVEPCSSGFDRPPAPITGRPD